MPPRTCCAPSPPPASTPPPPPRPRGLWRARATPAPPPASHAPHKFHTNPLFHLHHDDDGICTDDSDASSTASARKRRRLASDTPPTSDEEVLYWDYSRKCSPHPERLDKWVTRSKRMDTTSTAGPGAHPAPPPAAPTSCDLEDWEDLKELFAKAAEIYENEPPQDAMPLLRGVIHECHRFMRMYYDPSVVYAPPPPPDAARRPVQTPPDQRVVRDWLADRPPLYPPPRPEPELVAKAKARLGAEEDRKKCKCKDLPTAFYTILGTTLFFFGNLIDQDAALAAPGEAPRPTPYWLAAIDVFEIGENLPIRTSGRGCPGAPEDWRMAIIWGRTLVCLTHEALAREKDAGPAAAGTPDEPAWPPDSPFALIGERRLPRTGRMSLANTTPEEMMLIAKDQFSRGIFHMPHPLHHARRLAQAGPPQPRALPAVFTCTPPLTAYSASAPPPTAPAATDTEPDAPPPGLLPGETFSRAKELFTIASEVLDVAERFPAPSARAGLAAFADGLLGQMKLEANTERAGTYAPWAGAGAIVLARGRASLVVGAAKAEEIEGRIEAGDAGVWGCDEAVDGREALGVAVVYLEKAREALIAKQEEERAARGEAIVVERADDEDGDDEDMGGDSDEEEGEEGAVAPRGGAETTVEEVGTMLAEALLTLANLTEDVREREVLYARAQREGGDAIVLDEWDEEDGMEV
ncbi:hypothetical protein HYPSUDRAFT_66802 [Hypholoma sublateritium FD-334 SS-4]|uniref:Transcription factor domain-containing protein n=1 Tax=Hypholoma sublateritium (strain FD-334 SS-4) TaxID=945553 RepID=A0A0D2L712_HYPSF|nr:hypothetical protein HYPSUDRAFT_66802 [Hypholoma sublateritium FD-334 SS-4]